MKVKRSGFVYSLYQKNLINLWILAGLLLLVLVSMLYKSHNYLLNYLFYRAEPDYGLLSEFLEQDVLDIDAVCADIQRNGGEAALNRAPTYMFFRDNVYQEGGRYRFSLPMTPDRLTDTGIWYDDTYHAHSGVSSHAALMDELPRENYSTDHLYFYDWEGGAKLLVVTNYEVESELKEKARVTFAPLGVYCVYMLQDLRDAGYEEPVYNYFIDLRKTPVDFEDDDFKDLVLILPFVLLALIPAILFTVCPILHPTYRQLDKFARSIQKAADQVDANYAEYGILSEDKKTWYLEDWIIRRSLFKNGIEKNWKKQQY